MANNNSGPYAANNANNNINNDTNALSNNATTTITDNNNCISSKNQNNISSPNIQNTITEDEAMSLMQATVIATRALQRYCHHHTNDGRNNSTSRRITKSLDYTEFLSTINLAKTTLTTGEITPFVERCLEN